MTDDPLSRRRLAVLTSLALLSAFAVAAVCVRVVYTGSLEGVNLLWNLVLAWVPLGIALFLYDGYRRRGPLVLLAAGAAWLLFFPNAPYLMTSYKHLAEWGGGAPVWFDVVVISSAAWTGLVLAFVSLYLVQAVVRRAAGATAAWLAVVGSLALGSFGIYLGRFERWNSWDVIAHPRLLASDIWMRLSDPAAHPRTVAVTLLFTVFLTLAYFAFYSVLRLARSEQPDRA